jgi:hypothetical protein
MLNLRAVKLLPGTIRLTWKNCGVRFVAVASSLVGAFMLNFVDGIARNMNATHDPLNGRVLCPIV